MGKEAKSRYNRDGDLRLQHDQGITLGLTLHVVTENTGFFSLDLISGLREELLDLRLLSTCVLGKPVMVTSLEKVRTLSPLPGLAVMMATISMGIIAVR